MNGRVKQRALSQALLLAWLGAWSCAPRPVAPVRGIELEDPAERERRAAGGQAEGEDGSPDSALVASGDESSESDDSSFVSSREPAAERAREGSQLPIHINESWWPFRAQHLGISEAQAQKRDAQMDEAPPEDFWDSQTALEAVSVWTVLCNECHGGRRSSRDAVEMPAPAPAWGEGTGLFFGNRRAYSQMFAIVQNGVPVHEPGRVGMPAWRHILSNEMKWALLYFLEYQSGGIESRFPPSLYPRRPKMIGER